MSAKASATPTAASRRWRMPALYGCARQDGAMPFYVVGVGGVGRETLDVAMAGGLAVTAFLDDARTGETVRGLPVLSPVEAAEDSEFLVGIADPAARLRL